GGVAQARMPLQRLPVGAVLLVLLADFHKLPVVWPVREIAVILGVEIRGDVLRIPAKIVAEQEIGHDPVAPYPLASVDSESLQYRFLGSRVALPHDDLV